MCNIMITEQNKAISQCLTKKIKLSKIEPYTLITCGRTSDALEYIHAHDIDILFTRVENGLTGIEFAETVKKINLFTIVVGYGASNDFNLLLKAMSNGISYYLSNIYDMSEFMTVLCKAYEQHKRLEMEVKLKAEEEKSGKSFSSSFLNEWTANFCRNAMENNKETVDVYINYFCSAMEKQSILSAKRMIIETLVMLIGCLEKDGVELPMLPTKAKDYNSIIGLPSIEELKAWFKAKMEAVAKAAGDMLNAGGPDCCLMRALSYINRNYHKDISRDDIASQIHLNPSYFSHLFKAQTGQSFVEYLRQLRIERAKYLLEFTNDYQVHFKVGFNSSKYFAKVFRQQTGYTPSEYRKYCKDAQPLS